MTASLEYYQPGDWDEAWQLLSRPGGDAVPLMVGPHPPPLADWGAGAVVDLSRLGLNTITLSAEGEVRLGALAPLQALVESEELKTWDAGFLSTAASSLGAYALLNLASVGGALYEKGGPPELLLALLALDARVVVQTPQARDESPIAGYLEASAGGAQPAGVIVEVRIPALERVNSGWGLERVARTPRDAAIVAAAAFLQAEGDQVINARLCAAGAGLAPQRFRDAEQQLAGERMTDELLQRVAASVTSQAGPAADFRGSVAYRQAMAGVLCRRALAAAWQRASIG